MKIRDLIPGRIQVAFLLLLFLPFYLGYTPSPASAAEAQEEAAGRSKDSFNLILSYTDVTVGSGQDFEMDAEVVNRRKDPVHVLLTTESVPKGWEVAFHSRFPSYPVRGVMVQGEKSVTVELKAKIPKEIKPGKYALRVAAKDDSGTTTHVGNITFRITSQKVETGGLKLTSQYPVLSGSTGQTFKFSLDLKNETNKALTAALAAQAPAGWLVRFKPQFEETQISSIALKGDATETLSVEINSPIRAEAGDYPLTVKARSGAFEASADLKITLTGTYDVMMGIPARIGDQLALRLSTSVTVGKKSAVDFLVVNTGTAPLRNLSFNATKPEKWSVDFKPNKIDSLSPDDPQIVKMEIQTAERTIAGDYLFAVNAKSPDTSKSVDLRVTVSTPTFWGWIGAGIVAAVVLGLGVVFVRLGRR